MLRPSRLLNAYLKGCERVSGIVSKSDTFRVIVGERVPEELEAIVVSDEGNVAALYAAHLKKKLRAVRIYAITHSDICFFGGTENNLREFRFFLNVLKEQGVACTHTFFLRDFEAQRSKASEEIVENVFLAGMKWLSGNGHLTGSHLAQHLQYTQTFLAMVHSYAGKRELLPHIAVVANDHSPTQVGYSMAMECLGVPVVYVQHAEVSEVFPALDFTASVLRNQRSLETYRKVGRVKGKVFIVSRRFDKARFQDVFAPLSETAVVGIYPTSRFDPASIRRTIDSLRHNPAVRDYFVKLHPNSPITLTEEEADYFRIRSSAPDERHIAIVGNSSIVVELLSQGHPVYQLFALDNVEADYYGFVRAGLARSIEETELNKPFWQCGFYDENWLKRAARFEPSVEGDQQRARRELARYTKRLLKKRALFEAMRRLLPWT